jgi:hypothetical protein
MSIMLKNTGDLLRLRQCRQGHLLTFKAHCDEEER